MPKLAAVTLFAIARRHLDRFTEHFSIEGFSGQRCRFLFLRPPRAGGEKQAGCQDAVQSSKRLSPVVMAARRCLQTESCFQHPLRLCDRQTLGRALV